MTWLDFVWVMAPKAQKLRVFTPAILLPKCNFLAAGLAPKREVLTRDWNGPADVLTHLRFLLWCEIIHDIEPWHWHWHWKALQFSQGCDFDHLRQLSRCYRILPPSGCQSHIWAYHCFRISSVFLPLIMEATSKNHESLRPSTNTSMISNDAAWQSVNTCQYSVSQTFAHVRSRRLLMSR